MKQALGLLLAVCMCGCTARPADQEVGSGDKPSNSTPAGQSAENNVPSDSGVGLDIV